MWSFLLGHLPGIELIHISADERRRLVFGRSIPFQGQKPSVGQNFSSHLRNYDDKLIHLDSDILLPPQAALSLFDRIDQSRVSYV